MCGPYRRVDRVTLGKVPSWRTPRVLLLGASSTSSKAGLDLERDLRGQLLPRRVRDLDVARLRLRRRAAHDARRNEHTAYAALALTGNFRFLAGVYAGGVDEGLCSGAHVRLSRIRRGALAAGPSSFRPARADSFGVGRSVMRKAIALLTMAVAVVLFGGCSRAEHDGKREDPDRLRCLAQGHNSDYCDSRTSEG